MSIRFKRPALRNHLRHMDHDTLPADVTRLESAAIKIEPNLYLGSLFASLRPFLTNNVEPSQEFLDMKFTEALGCILRTDPAFYPTLFDFNEAWKIDLLKFMEEHFTEDMSIEDFATYTGRSLATFKRDFAKISPASSEMAYRASSGESGRTAFKWHECHRHIHSGWFPQSFALHKTVYLQV